MLTLYNVISSDGFIAGKNGNEDFIPDGLFGEFLSLCIEYGTVVLGRKSYDAIQGYDETLIKALEELPIKKIVVSGDPIFQPKPGYLVIRSPEEAAGASEKVLVSSGPTINNYLIKEKLVDKIILCEVPVSIGEGIKPFDRNTLTLLPTGNSHKLLDAEVKEYEVKYL